jgi:hypothetical protein
MLDAGRSLLDDAIMSIEQQASSIQQQENAQLPKLPSTNSGNFRREILPFLRGGADIRNAAAR